MPDPVPGEGGQTALAIPRPRKQRLKLTAEQVKDALRRRHGCDRAGFASGEWVCIAEALSGYADGCGGIDLLALGVWRSAKAPGLPGAGRSRPNPVVAYEVKVSRADFRRELYGVEPKPRKPEDAQYWWRPSRRVPPWPIKARYGLRHSNYFMFAVPAGLLDDNEIDCRERPGEGRGLWLPPEAGLIEVGEDGRCRVRVTAPPSDATPLSVHQTAELIRYAISRAPDA